MNVTLYTVEYLTSIFDYNPTTGITYWKERPRTDFRYATAHRAWKRKHSHTQAGIVDPSTGKLRVSMFSKGWMLDQLIWKLLTGNDVSTVYHQNGCNADNKINNLTRDPTGHKPTKHYGGELYLTKDTVGNFCIISSNLPVDSLSPPITPTKGIHVLNFYKTRKDARTELLELVDKLQTSWHYLDE